MKFRDLIFAISMIFLSTLAGIAQNTASVPIATIRAAFGVVEVLPSGGNWTRATVGMELKEGARIRTASTGKATVQFGDLGVAKVAPSSVARLADLRRVAGKINLNLELMGGTIDASFRRRNDAVYELRTPVTATGVRGTTFRTSVSPARRFSTTANLSEIEVASVANYLLDGELVVSGTAIEDGEVSITSEQSLTVLSTGEAIIGELPTDISAELKAMREEANRILADPNYTPELVLDEPSFEILVKARTLRAREGAKTEELVAALTDLFDRYERCDQNGFMNRIADDFRGQYVANSAGTFFDKWRLKDSLEEDCRNLVQIAFEVNVRAMRPYATGDVEMELEWRQRFFLLGVAREVRRENQNSRIRWRKNSDGEWRVIWWEGDPIFGLYDPVTGAATTASTACPNADQTINGPGSITTNGTRVEITNSSVVSLTTKSFSNGVMEWNGATFQSGGNPVTVSNSSGSISSSTFDNQELFLSATTSMTVSGGSFRSPGLSGISIGGVTSNLTISGASFSGNTDGIGTFGATTLTNVTISGNTFSSNTNLGINGGSADFTNVAISSNTFSNQGLDGIG